MAKLANLMNKLNEAKKKLVDWEILYHDTVKGLQKTITYERKTIRDRDKQIKELKAKIEVLMSE